MKSASSPISLYFMSAAAILAFGTGSARAALVHDYEFSDSSAAIDGVGSANGVLQGGATISGGQLHLNGTSAYVSFADYLVPTGANPYSVAISVNIAAVQNTGGFVEIISQGSSFRPGFYIGSNGGSAYRLTDNFTSTSAPFTSGQHDLLFSSGPTGSRFFIDGTLAFSSMTQATIGGGGTPTYFGKQFGGFGEYFTGDVSSIRIYDTVVSPGPMSAVPLPAAAPMFGAGLLALGFAGFRSRKRARLA